MFRNAVSRFCKSAEARERQSAACGSLG